jgi:hypothetical protein
MDAFQICDRLKAKFALARCWPEGSKIYIRYATGFSEYLSVGEATAMLAQ